MINYNVIINDDTINFADQLNQIDMNTSIVLCSNKDEKHVKFDDMNRVTFITSQSIPFTNFTSINNCSVYEYHPKIKLYHPLGVSSTFIEPYDGYFYNKIYTSNDVYFSGNSVLYNKIQTVILIDRTMFKHFKKPLAINKNESVLSLEFTYNINSDDNTKIKNIYYIRDNFVYEKFLDHFGK